MKQTSFLITALLTLAVIGCAGAKTAQSNTETMSRAVKHSSPTPLAQAQTDPLAQARIKPNYQFNVQRQAGNCPKSVGLWMFWLGVEGGSDRTVVADTTAISSGPVN